MYGAGYYGQLYYGQGGEILVPELSLAGVNFLHRSGMVVNG